MTPDDTEDEDPHTLASLELDLIDRLGFVRSSSVISRAAARCGGTKTWIHRLVGVGLSGGWTEMTS